MKKKVKSAKLKSNNQIKKNQKAVNNMKNNMKKFMKRSLIVNNDGL